MNGKLRKKVKTEGDRITEIVNDNINKLKKNMKEEHLPSDLIKGYERKDKKEKNKQKVSNIKRKAKVERNIHEKLRRKKKSEKYIHVS